MDIENTSFKRTWNWGRGQTISLNAEVRAGLGALSKLQCYQLRLI